MAIVLIRVYFKVGASTFLLRQIALSTLASVCIFLSCFVLLLLPVQRAVFAEGTGHCWDVRVNDHVPCGSNPVPQSTTPDNSTYTTPPSYNRQDEQRRQQELTRQAEQERQKREQQAAEQQRQEKTRKLEFF